MATTLRRFQTRSLAPVQRVSSTVGALFVMVGFAGFIPGVTTGYGSLTWMGMDSQARLLGLFQVSILHNLVHIAFGVVGILLARRARTARLYLLVGGAIYLLLFLYGVLIDPLTDANFVPVNSADNWLHAVLGVAMVALGLMLPARLRERIGG
ncbi:DUF4383 domain-containing protein [Smaragdicoccus niigatensis]|uniref:DUF4383 domain-containing protein n=1 Tax=Smaragdicoccus niigatensis TaxID=359359 RepID=UPI0003797A96|nr:DUF4383 domain-containing protein [Smaragdicoccus niigatensis]